MRQIQSRVAVLATTIFLLSFIPANSIAEEHDALEVHTPGGPLEISSAGVLTEIERGGLLIARFRGEASEEQLQQLQAAGISIAGHLEGNAYWIRCEPGSDAAGLPFVEAVARPGAWHKITPPAAAELAERSAGENVTVGVSFFEGVSAEAVTTLLGSLGGRAVEDRMLYGRRLHVELPAVAVDELAVSEMVRAVEAGPRQRIAVNARAAKASMIHAARADWDLSGTGVAGAIWDEGKVDSHPDLEGSVELVERRGRPSEHATHVAGTIVGSGEGRSAARGMAPDAHLYSFNFRGDIPTEMAEAIDDHDIVFASNSWTYGNGWGYFAVIDLWVWFGDYYFGHYSAESAAYDELVHETGLIILFAAGNDRTDVGTDERYLDVTIGRGSDEPHPPDGPFRTIDTTSASKNVISVGAVNRRGKMTRFSSWGPTKDGRVKPEIVADGRSLLSTVLEGGYDRFSGTSMATPTVAGGVALLVEQFRSELNRTPSAAEVRAILAATATDLGAKGPDYTNGFGMLNVGAAADLIGAAADRNLIITSIVRKTTSQRTRRFRLRLGRGIGELKIALAWSDPPAQPNAELTLVNDLDLRLYRGGSEDAELPWVLDGANPSVPATRGVNTVDNIELLQVDNPISGIWIIEVTASRLSLGNGQSFALAVSSDEPDGCRIEEIR